MSAEIYRDRSYIYTDFGRSHTSLHYTICGSSSILSPAVVGYANVRSLVKSYNGFSISKTGDQGLVIAYLSIKF